MRNAERGSSQIPLVICIFLLLGAAFMAYSQYTDNQALDARIKRLQDSARSGESTMAPSDQAIMDYVKFARGDGAKFQGHLEKVGEVVGAKNEADMTLVVDPAKVSTSCSRVLESLDKKDFTVEFPVDRYLDDPQTGGIKVQEQAGKIIVKYGGTQDLRGVRPDMTNILDFVCIPAMNRMVSDIKRYRDAYATAMRDKLAAEDAHRKTLAQKDSEIKAKVEETVAVEARKNQEVVDLRRQLSEAEAAKAAAEEEKNKLHAQLTAELKTAKTEAEKKSGEV